MAPIEDGPVILICTVVKCFGNVNVTDVIAVSIDRLQSIVKTTYLEIRRFSCTVIKEHVHPVLINSTVKLKVCLPNGYYRNNAN
ncbi:hypothetical protein I4U23_011566 [Adineta vaga]|nr:hypothetical protein I4U23_011566 [Adineta vaga]